MTAAGRQMLEERRGQVMMAGVALAVLLAVGLGYTAWTSRASGRAHTLLAEAMALESARIGPAPAPGLPAPAGPSFETARARNQAALTKYKVAADEYPSTPEGIFARYRQAATYMALGEPAGGAKAFQEAIDQAGPDTLYGQLARLGLAEANAQTGQYDQAIATFKELSQRKDGQVPVDGVLMSLARACLGAGKTSDAEQAFKRLVDEFPDSPFVQDATRGLDELKKS